MDKLVEDNCQMVIKKINKYFENIPIIIKPEYGDEYKLYTPLFVGRIYYNGYVIDGISRCFYIEFNNRLISYNIKQVDNCLTNDIITIKTRLKIL